MLRFLTAGESHGPALVVIVEGLPAGLAVTVEDIQAELARRRLGYGRGPAHAVRGRRADAPRRRAPRPHARLAGRDRDQQHRVERSDKWHEEMSPAPGQRPRSRSPSRGPATPTSPACRSTASPTPATCSSGRARGRPRRGSPPGRWPSCCSRELGIEVLSHVVQLGAARSDGAAADAGRPADVDESPVRCFDPAGAEAMIAEIKAAAKDGDSLGGVVEVLGYGVPVGLGSHVHWDRKLDALLAQALMSIQAMKGVEIGDGFEVAGRRGSEAHDAIRWDADAGDVPPRHARSPAASKAA